MISKIITKNIVRPINEIDLDNPDTMFIYDEIYPLIKKLESQNKIISEQMIDLRDKRIEFEAITENMNEGFIILDTNSHVLSYNTAAIKFLDVAEVEERISNIIVFNRSKRFQRVAKEALSGNRSECVLELHNNMYHIIANPVMDDEIVKGAVLLIMDATEKEQRERLRREFSANVSHELKTPLTSISGYAEIIKSKMVKPEDIEKFAGIIHTEAVRLIELVKDIIKISKLDESNELFEEKEVDIYNLCQDIRKRLEKQAEDKNIEISITGESVIIKTVDHIVDEIIYNLIDNAIKYNKNNGQITVSVKETKTRVNVTVSDTGIGIPKADLNRIFERFYRVDKSHSKDVGGTGLGLSIVKHGANYLGADIKVESEEEKGTIISVSFKK
jgi:two-component system phosphate regulon sensor histidine kinase PhoR